MENHVCTVCGYVYVPADGCEDQEVAPNTAFADVKEDFICPICGVGKDLFEVE